WGLSHLMEHYKKVWRKDRAGVWEIRSISAVLSVACAFALLPLNLLMVPADTGRFVMGVVYSVLIYVAQLTVDMTVVKKLAVVAIEEKLKDFGVTEDDLAKLKKAANA
ncbi:MAG: hypothetical protein WCQ66_10245, partial [Sphaerochaetaceae bacterium]